MSSFLPCVLEVIVGAELFGGVIGIWCSSRRCLGVLGGWEEGRCSVIFKAVCLRFWACFSEFFGGYRKCWKHFGTCTGFSGVCVWDFREVSRDVRRVFLKVGGVV